MLLQSTVIASSILISFSALSATAQDGENLVPNPGFEKELLGWNPFGNAFANNKLTHDFSLFALKMHGGFSGPYNGNGAISATSISVTPGVIHRLAAYVQNPSWDPIFGTQNWCGIKVEFRDANGVLTGLGEQQVLSGTDPNMIQDDWVEANFLVDPPAGSATASIIPVFLQVDPADPGACWIDDITFATAERDFNAPIVNGAFDNGVDWSYSTYPIFNGWNEQYGNAFFDNLLFRSPPFSAGLFGEFLDTDGDEKCDAPGVSGYNQWIPNVGAGREVILECATLTSIDDSILGTMNQAIQKIEFFGVDTSTPLETVEGELLNGLDPKAQNDVWYLNSISATSPAGTESMRIVLQLLQPDCEVGSVRIDDVVVTLDGSSPSDCPGDFNTDGTVNGADFGTLLAAWGPCTCPEDLTNDGEVNGADVGLLLSYWGPCPEDYNCDVPHDGPGCNDDVCEAIVCDLDPICCVTNWDQVCANLAAGNCP